MEKKNPIQEELKAISPELASLLPPKIAVPNPDADYFERLPGKLLDKVKQTPVVNFSKRNTIIKYIIGSTAAAAIIAVLFIVGMEFNQPEQSIDLSTELAKISKEDLEAFLVSNDQIEPDAEIQHQLKQLDLNEIKSFYIYNNYEN